MEIFRCNKTVKCGSLVIGWDDATSQILPPRSAFDYFFRMIVLVQSTWRRDYPRRKSQAKRTTSLCDYGDREFSTSFRCRNLRHFSSNRARFATWHGPERQFRFHFLVNRNKMGSEAENWGTCHFQSRLSRSILFFSELEIHDCLLFHFTTQSSTALLTPSLARTQNRRRSLTTETVANHGSVS